jgi:diacylglycerol kinase family enzyme
MTTPSTTPPRSALIPAFINDAAGTADGVEAALAGNTRFEVHRLAPDALEPAMRAAVAAGVPRIVVAGGDGSIASAAAILAGTPVELGVLPAGTLNHFAKHLGIPLELPEAVSIAAGTIVRTVDAASVNGRIFVNTSSVGAYVRFVRQREWLERRFGYRVASVLAGARIFARLRWVRVLLEFEGTARAYRTPFVFVGVGERELKLPLAGGRLPEGARDLHVIVPRVHSRMQLVRLVWLALVHGVGRATDALALDAFLVDHCRIEMPGRHGNVALDGEITPMLAPLDYRLMPDALRVVVGR